MQVTSLPQRLAAEALGTGFLLATIVGSGIMAANLAGGNGAIALLCNTLPTGAILVVLILVGADRRARAHLGRSFQPCGQSGFRCPQRTAVVDSRSIRCGPSVGRRHWCLGGAPDVRSSGLAGIDTRPLGGRRMVGGSRRYPRFVAYDIRLSGPHTYCCSLRCRPLHHGRILVHGVDLLR